MNFTALDFETANRQKHSACSIALVKVIDNQIVDEYYSLIKPETFFDQKNIAIHGIHERDVENAPNFYDLWPDIAPYFTDKSIIAAHNVPFDRGVLFGTLDYYGISKPNFQTIDTVSTSRRLVKQVPNHKLNTMAHYYDLALRHHHALDDARVCAQILIEQIKAFGEESIGDLVRQIRH